MPEIAGDNFHEKHTDCNCVQSILFTDEEKLCADNKDIVPNNHKELSKTNTINDFYFHLGILTFAPYLNQIKTVGLDFILQWLVAILLGCQNIEQSKELNYTSLEKILGKTTKTLSLQRSLLRQYATTSNTNKIIRFNAQLISANQQRDFYYDPHTKHYTGHLKILSTWCSSIRLADKGLNMDYIHTTSGHPVYFNTTDNFYDLRERFFVNIDQFRQICDFPHNAIITYIIDRGIYAIDVFKHIIKDPHSHIITWEKDYKNDQWDSHQNFGKGAIEKQRNNKRDIKLTHYHYQEKTWEKDPDMRQIIVRIYDKNWKVLIEVSILTDDKNRHANQIIQLMLKRWVQENDFKYMIKHFGINQITSYAFTDYKALINKIEDKIFTCNKHKVLTKEIQKVRAKLKTALFDQHQFHQKHNKPDAKLSPKLEERKQKINKRIQTYNTLLIKLEQQRRDTTKYVSKIQELIDHDYSKLDTDVKSFMDAIKMLARNIFYLAFQSFKEKYDNYRDDHQLFRHLTRSAGTIQLNSQKINITVIPQAEYQPKTKRIIQNIFDEINQKNCLMPDDSGKTIVLKIDV